MAAASFQPIGSEDGPCEECEHTDCAETRRMMATLCEFCREPIGTRRFFRGDTWQDLTHEVCAYRQQEATERLREALRPREQEGKDSTHGM